MDATVLGRATLTFAVLVCALGLVTWRQSRAFEAHRLLDDLRREVAVAQAERLELEREVQVLRSRARIVPEATEYGMHTPVSDEQVILARGGTP